MIKNDSKPKKVPKYILNEIDSRFKYNSITGDIRYKKRVSRNTDIGFLAGTIKTNTGYGKIFVGGRVLQSHRVAWYLYYGKMPKQYIDHVNGDKLDNRIKNLREVTKRENSQNIKKPYPKNKCGYLGVCRTNKSLSYSAAIRIKGKTTHIGVFKTAIEAHEAYLKVKRKHHKTCTI